MDVGIESTSITRMYNNNMIPTILKAISSKIPEGATLLLSFIRSKLNEKNEVKDIATLDQIRTVINSLIDGIQN